MPIWRNRYWVKCYECGGRKKPALVGPDKDYLGYVCENCGSNERAGSRHIVDLPQPPSKEVT